MVHFPKNVKRGLVALVCSSAMGSYFIFKDNGNKEEKYAVLVCATDETNTQYHKNIDPIDADLDTVALSEIYKTLKENGFEDKNMKILYSQKPFTPNFNEEKNHDALQEIKKNHFNNSYSNEATEKNIFNTLKELKEKIDYNDKFVFYLFCHGGPTGTQHMGNFGRGDALTPDELKSCLGGFNSKSNLFLFVSCYSGAVLDRIDIKNSCMISATQSHTLGWVDRNFDIASIYISAKYNKKNDRNQDGFVDVQEAYEAAVKEAVVYDEQLRDYILYQYRGPSFSGSRKKDLREMSLIPRIEVGKFFRDFK